jgi:hypothetical protein
VNADIPEAVDDLVQIRTSSASELIPSGGVVVVVLGVGSPAKQVLGLGVAADRSICGRRGGRASAAGFWADEPQPAQLRG